MNSSACTLVEVTSGITSAVFIALAVFIAWVSWAAWEPSFGDAINLVFWESYD